MSDDATQASSGSIKNLGWRVTFAGLGINLALGILYTWSVLSKGVPKEWGWSNTHKSLPYSVACLAFCLIMVPAGRMQDKLSPRLTALIGGVLVGGGMILASLFTHYMGFVIGFGVLAGSGIGFAYASATPPAIKWFPKSKTGMIAGLVVSGFGLASVYAAPLSKYLIGSIGLSWTFRILGIAFLALVCGLALLLSPPPPDYKPEEDQPAASAAGGSVTKVDFTPGEMLKTWQFYLLWFMFAAGAGAGLMIISKLSKIATDQAGLKLGFVMVAVLAIGNGGGRVVAGLLSDKIGKKATVIGCFSLQAILIFLLTLTVKDSAMASVPVFAVVAALIGANYGANLAIFPAFSKAYYGAKNFGINYGLVFTSWGIGGFILALVAGRVYDQYQTFNFAYYTSVGILVVAALGALLLKPVSVQEKSVPAPAE